MSTRRRSRGTARPSVPRRPVLTPELRREIAGVLLVGLGLLAGLALVRGSGPLLVGLRTLLVVTFGIGSPLVVIAAIGGGALLVWPHGPEIRRLQLVAGAAAGLGLLGLLSLASAPAGGAAGHVALRLAFVAGPVGGPLVLVVALVVSTVAAGRVSVAAAASLAVRAIRAGGRRLPDLARLPGRLLPHLNRLRAPAGRLAAAAHETPPEMPEPEVEIATEDEAPATEPPADGEIAEPEERASVDWELPTLDLLDPVAARREQQQAELRRTARTIESTLATFGVQARVLDFHSGPSVTRYELQAAPGVPVRKVVALQNDLSLALAASPLRIEAPIPGKSAIGIEVPNRAASLVTIRELASSAGFQRAGGVLAVPLGNDVAGEPVSGDLTRMPHLLIAGATGQGKSICVNTLICGLLLRHSPAELRLVLVDPKRVELQGYAGLPHLACPVTVEHHQAAAALRWAVAEMERRYKTLAAEGVRNIAAYNERPVERPLPYVVIVIDELADLMMVAAGEIEDLICRVAQLARAVGIHLVISTQRPSTDVITGLIKANVPSRIAFAVGSSTDSRVILDRTGAEKLLGRGDMLYLPVDAGTPARLQGAFITDREVEALVRFWRDQGEPEFLDEVLEDAEPAPERDGSGRVLDPLFARAARAVAAEGAASVSLVQRKFNVGYARAGRIVDQLAEHRVVGGAQGSKSREVLMSLPEVAELLEGIGLES